MLSTCSVTVRVFTPSKDPLECHYITRFFNSKGEARSYCKNRIAAKRETPARIEVLIDYFDRAFSERHLWVRNEGWRTAR